MMIDKVLTNLVYLFYPQNICAYTQKEEYSMTKEYNRLKEIIVDFDNKKRILVPFLSEDKNNVQGVLSLAKDADGKTTFDITDRYFSMRENSPLLFWDSGTWLGYIIALDKDILGKENGNPGVATRIAKNNPKNVLTMRTECSIQVEEIVFYTITF